MYPDSQDIGTNVLKSFTNMRKLCYLIVLGLLPWTTWGQTVILDHETPGTTNPFTYFGNCTLDGANTGLLANPDASGLNTSANVGSFTKTGCALTFAGCFGNPAPATPVNLAINNQVRMKVWMDHVGSVSLKLEGSTNGGANWLQTQPVTAINQWVEVSFNMTLGSIEPPFTAASGFNYVQVVLFFDFGAPGTGADVTSYYDDIVTDFVFTLAPIDLPITWDNPAVNYTVTDFGDNMSALTADPFDAGNNVMSTTKPVSAPLWAGTTMSTPAGLASPIAMSNANTRMSVRVLSPNAGIPVRLKIEDAADPTRSVETEAVTTVANTWETLIFDFANEAPGTAALNISYTFNKASIFFNFGTDGATAGEKTYLWDNVAFIGGGGTGIVLIDLPITFDEPGVEYTLTDFEGNSTVLAADPEDAGNTVARTTKGPGAQFFAGTTMSTTAGFANPIPVTFTESTMSIRVYSPNAGIVVRLKIEDATDPTRSVETDVINTVANGWETLVFDFNNEVTGTAILNPSYSFTKASVFFNFGVDGNTAGEKIYLWDDIYFGLPPLGCDNSTAPSGLSSTIGGAGVTLNWNPLSQSLGCLVQGAKVGSAPTKIRVPGAEVSSTFIPYARLEAGATYKWAVACGCDLTPASLTPYSSVALFSVPALRTASMQVSNPVSSTLNLVWTSSVVAELPIQLTDLSGRTLATWNTQVLEGANTMSFDVQNIPNGMYLLHGGSIETPQMVVVQH